MAIKNNLTGVGVSPNQALQQVGTVTNSLTATGTTQADAYALGLTDYNIFTTVAASTGARLPSTMSAGDEMWVVNYGASTLSLYPPTGGKINNGSANAAISITANKNANIVCIDGTNFVAAISA